MKTLSLFNGISALHLALDKAEIKVSQVYYAEIDKYANKITERHYPDDVALGDVTKWREWNIDWTDIGLVGAGFPCQAWSTAGKQLGDKDERGMLFWTTLEIIAHVLKHNPKAKFLMENVKMKKDFEQYITHHTEQALGHVEKTLINSALVSAQNRQRYYWTNFKVTQPDDKGVLLRDILEESTEDKYQLSKEAIDYMGRLRNGKPRWEYHKNPVDGKAACLTANMFKGVPYGVLKISAHAFNRKDGIGKELNKAYCLNASDWRGLNRNQTQTAVVLGGAIRGRYNDDGSTSQRLELNGTEKTNSLTTVQKDNVAVYEDMTYRKLTPLECERLQTFPWGWTDSISNTQRYKALGNAWTVDVIVHILKCAFK